MSIFCGFYEVIRIHRCRGCQFSSRRRKGSIHLYSACCTTFSLLSSFIRSSLIGMPSEQRIVMGPPPVQKLSMSACDPCRARKSKCDARQMTHGSPCSQCSKQGSKCTISPRSEPQLITRARQNQLATSAQHSTASSSPAHFPPESRPQQPGRSIKPPPPDVKALNGTNRYTVLLTSSCRELPHQRLHVAGRPQVMDAPMWNYWNIPTVIADTATGRLRTMETIQIVELLLERFYAERSCNTIIVPYHALSICRIRYGKPSLMPHYLLHTMVACAATSQLTAEAELQLWRTQAWHGATEAVHNRLNRSGSPELELIQSLLLLACNWSGSLLRVERINTFDTAVSLATSLQLHSGLHLDTLPGPRSSRVALFWFLFCADKFISIMLKRLPLIPTESHSVPLPTLSDVEEVCDLPSRTAGGAWLQRLVHAMIQLSQIAESIQRTLLLPVTIHQVTSLENVLARMNVLEKQLESFCKEQRWLLGTAPDMSALCRTLSEAIITHLHFTQLHLYLPALQVEVDQRGTQGVPFSFSDKSAKPLAATIESAWHLVRQPLDINFHSNMSIAQIVSMLSSNRTLDEGISTHMTFSHATFLVGVNFFRFLSTYWSDWDDGRGCTRCSSIKMPELQKSSEKGKGNEREEGSSVASEGMTCRKSLGSIRPKQPPEPLRLEGIRSNDQRKRKDIDNVDIELITSASSTDLSTPVGALFEGLDKIKRDIAVKATEKKRLLQEAASAQRPEESTSHQDGLQ